MKMASPKFTLFTKFKKLVFGIGVLIFEVKFQCYDTLFGS